MSQIFLIVILSVMGPIIGSLIGVIKKPSEKFLYNMLSFAAGVMLAISFLELIPESINLSSNIVAIIGVVLGAVTMYIIDKTIPHIHPQMLEQEHGSTLKKTATYLIIGIFLHNFPEGMAIAINSVSDTNVSITIALAIAIHNIPEGICTSAPYYLSSGKKLKSFLVSSLTAVPILIGFIFAHFLYQYISIQMVGMIIASTAGLMIYICADELIPTANTNIDDHTTIFSLISGIILVMLLGLI